MAAAPHLTAQEPRNHLLLFPSLNFPSDTWKGAVPLAEAGGQGPAFPGRPLPRPAQPLLPFSPARLPRSQRWAGEPWMTAREPQSDSPSPPPRARAFPAQSSPRSRGAPSAPLPEPPQPGCPRLLRELGSRLGTREEGGRQGTASSDPETPYKEQEGSPAGTTLIWAAPYLERPDMAWLLPAPGGGKKAEGRGGGKAGEFRSSLSPGVLSCGLGAKLPRSRGTSGAGAGMRPEVRDGGAHGSRRGAFASLRVLPAGLAILGLPASHIWPCTSRRRRVRAVPDPSNRGGSGESREIPARRTWGAAAAAADSCRRRRRRQLPPPPKDRPLPQPR